ncbi:conserved hypothetical protein [Microbacterium sp. 8M]|nr:conserved hypothetical protein [Microbacterium sp. 8M]
MPGELAVGTAVPAPTVTPAAVRGLAVMRAAVAVLSRRPRPAPAQQAQRGDDRVEGIRGVGVLRHEPILHAT